MSKESHPTSHHDNTSATSQDVCKQDKTFNPFQSSSLASKVEQSQSNKTTRYHLSTVSTEYNVDTDHAVATTEVKSPVSNAQASALPTSPRFDIFPENMRPPAGFVSLPEIGSFIDTTPQLALCIGLLPKNGDSVDKQEDPSQILSTGTAAQLAWLDVMKQDPVEQERLRWLGTHMVDEFAKDPSKDSTEIAEMVLIGPVLDNEHFRRLLLCTITAFDQAVLLDVDLLQGLIQLVQSAPSEALLPDDFVQILRILRGRLQDTHQQSSVHPFHLTLAVSRLLDVMADHKVKDLDRVEEHEPLSGVLSGLKASSDPYLMYQACYAFQALQYVPNNESPLQAILRHSTGVVDGLVKISAVFKMDLEAVLDGLGEMQEALGSVAEVVGTAYDGACSVLEGGRGVFDNVKEGLGSSQKHPWYTAIRAAYALAQAGQLKDLNMLIYKAPCRREPLFQWGICQLLGEIATDDIWDTNIRLQVVVLLGELYMNDPLWGQDESVRTWMLNILRQLDITADQAISARALALLKDLNQDQNTSTRLPYPLWNRFPLPASSPTLARVLAIPDVEIDLHKLKLQRLEDHRKGVYIHPQAKPNLQASDDKLFPLMEKGLEFLASERQVFLVLGDSGAGKSTFNLELEQALWKAYKKHGPIPLHISLPTIDNPGKDLIEKQLQYLNFSEDQILEMKIHRKFILICDGYDESQLKVNIHTSNQFNRPRQWNVKMVISCRTQYLGSDYRSRFQPQPVDRYQSVATDLFQEAVVAAFSKAQIKQYVEEYVKELPTVDPLHDRPSWTANEYMEKLTGIPNLMDLVSNPFLLTLALDALPSVVESNKDLSAIKITRVHLYDSFVKRWLEVNRKRLEASPLSNDERTELDMLIEDNFLYHGVHYQMKLAISIFLEHGGKPAVKYTHLHEKYTWKAAFFSPNGQAKLLRESSTVMRSGAFFQFLHRSLLEYFYSRTIYDPLDCDAGDVGDGVGDEREPGPDLMTCLSRMSIVKEHSILQFLAERVGQDPSFHQQLRDAIEQSKTESSATIAATNAITILVRAGALFNGADLRGIKIADADLSYGQFDSTQFQGADLTRVNLSRSWLRQADLSHAQLEGVQFGELPYLEMEGYVKSCAYSPDGRMLGVALWIDGPGIGIYDTSTWQRIHLAKSTDIARSVVFSPDSRRIVSGDWVGVVQVWDCTSGEEMLTMKEHTGFILSLAYSPCGNRIASSSGDDTVRLWDSETGVCVFVLEGHTDMVYVVRFSPDGRQLVSSSRDETIRLWNSETGEPGVVLSLLLGEIHSLDCSPDGQWIASGHLGGDVRLWDMVSGSPGPVLQGHTDDVTGIVFSPNGQLIATSSTDRRVIVWDASTGAFISTFEGHSDIVWDVSFSPDSLTIASGSEDMTLRLWEVNSSRSSIAVQDQIGDAVKVAYSPDGLSIRTIDRAGVIRQGSATIGLRGSVSFELPDSETIAAWAFSADGSRIAIGYDDSTVRLWDCRTGMEGPVLEGLSYAVGILAYSTCGRWIAICYTCMTVRLWDLHDTEQQCVLVDVGEGESDWIYDLKFSPTGHQLAVSLDNGGVWFFDPRTRVHLASKKFGEEAIWTLDYSPNGQQLALGTQKSITLWDMQSDEPLLKLAPPNSSQDVYYSVSITYSPCGQFLASTGADCIVHIWHRQPVEGDIDSWSYASALCVFHDIITSLSWNPVVPTEFITSSRDGSVRVWRVSSDDDTAAVKMLWGTNLRRLCSAGVILEDATGLSPIHQTLLAQRSTIDHKMASIDNGTDDGSEYYDGSEADDGSKDGDGSEVDDGSKNEDGSVDNDVSEDDNGSDDGFESDDGSDEDE
ncbi:MAG: WD40-repeat-containing domain protein [Linnemannia elongata]|nr:MAG: WD40-repeat-containing domain protein [Linnemannia elongata]